MPREIVKQIGNCNLFGEEIYRYKSARLEILPPSPFFIYFRRGEQDDAEELLDILAFLKHKPFFIYTDNEVLNDDLSMIYETISSTDYSLRSDCGGVPLKEDGIFERLSIYGIEYPVLLALYNTVMKQPEPLARCVFLFRIIENVFGNTNYCPVVPVHLGNGKNDYKTYIENLFVAAMRHYFMPLVCWNYRDLARRSYFNMIVKWKRKAKTIQEKFANHNIRLGEEVYKVGRCGVAHARPNDFHILHDYSNDYKRVGDINIILYLVCRYLIEVENPKLRKVVAFKYGNQIN